MFTVVAISVAAMSAPYMLQYLCLVNYQIRLQKKVLITAGIFVWSVMLLGIQPMVLADIPFFRFVQDYKELTFVVALSLAMLAGRLLRPWKHSLYQKLD